MTSPLLQFANGRILVPAEGGVSQVNGRWVTSNPYSYLGKLFIKRMQYTGTTSGSKKIPLASQLNGEMMPGASGDQFFYRGYTLEYVQVDNDWDLETSDETGLIWSQMVTQPNWIIPDKACKFRFGQDPIMFNARIERSSGIFGGQGIDDIIYKEMGGVQVQITGGEMQS